MAIKTDASRREEQERILAYCNDLPNGPRGWLAFFLGRAHGAEVMCDDLMAKMLRLIEERNALQAFKTYVHGRLDKLGVPNDPDPEQNAQHGCRIEGRIDWLLGELTNARLGKEVAEHFAEERARRLDAALKRAHDAEANKRDPA